MSKGDNLQIFTNFINSKLISDLVSSDKKSKVAKTRNRYNQVPHLIQDTNGKVTNPQLDTTNESQEAIPFPYEVKNVL